MATNPEYIDAEEVVKIKETHNGEVIGTVYCIHDPQFGHWMSNALFGGELWTKDFSRARKFKKRRSAEMHLEDLQAWRIGKERDEE